MKADLYVQGHFWATIEIPGDSLLALLAKGMITEANEKAAQLARELTDLDQIQCTVSLCIRHGPTYTIPHNTADPNQLTPSPQSTTCSLPPHHNSEGAPPGSPRSHRKRSRTTPR